MSSGSDSCFRRLGSKSDPDEIYAAYLSVANGGDINPMVEAMLPYVMNIVWLKYPQLDADIRDDVMGEMAIYLLRYVPKLAEIPFTSGAAILSYASRRLKGVSVEFLNKAQTRVEDFDVRQIPFMYMPTAPDDVMEGEEREEYKRNYAIDNIRLSDIRKRHALVMIDEDRKALIGVTTPGTIRFIADYLAVLARIADREYNAA